MWYEISYLFSVCTGCKWRVFSFEIEPLPNTCRKRERSLKLKTSNDTRFGGSLVALLFTSGVFPVAHIGFKCSPLKYHAVLKVFLLQLYIEHSQILISLVLYFRKANILYFAVVQVVLY